jgi:hypothetical protein
MPLNNMSQLPVQQSKPTWWREFTTKVQRAYLALRTPASLPVHVVQLPNGILLDLHSNTIVVSGELNIHSTGTMRLSSDEHVILNSGGGKDSRGETQGIWLNAVLDDDGLPVEIAGEIEVDHGDIGECS